jgi:hypothetical protein
MTSWSSDRPNPPSPEKPKKPKSETSGLNAALTFVGVVFLLGSVYVVLVSPSNFIFALLGILAACILFAVGSHFRRWRSWSAV